ncbi:Flagellar hook-associated protein FlgL [Olavius algarvensis spirochete endosymbiont]|uniref:flagellar hook-associated protein 3 n=1 Tax=Olavius algarvensis spirochete endosymbiont TaxID=260710 RepID=UPI000F0F6D83|nr:flagellar hook-associated protein 3 [Olavius algarvensis spirochete endosymbiont]VDB01268.1 Flagellar hook-associated protein FlgL [Olavius algarvensis spirochete endosymbiont]
MRISTYMSMQDSRFRMSERDFRMSQVQRAVASSQAIGELRDAPVDAAHVTRLDSSGKRLEKYMKNIDYIRGRWLQAEGYMNEALTIVHRLRELSIQGANGIYSRESMNNMAIEVDALISELSLIINAKGGDGQYLFAGDEVSTPPFLINIGRVPGIRRPSITSIIYEGDINRSRVEITDGQTVKSNLKGNEIFWAENQQIFGASDTEGFMVSEQNRFIIDEKEVVLEIGDNIHTVVRKINDSGAPVKASIDPVTGSLNLETTVPHQIWLEPAEGRALIDMGLLTDRGGTSPPMNWHPDAVVAGGSILDQGLTLRDALIDGDQERVGGVVIGGLDKGLDTLLRNLADLGAKGERLEFAVNRLADEFLTLTEWKSRLADADLTEAITEMSMLEYTQRAAYHIAGRILQPTLMDFLR